MANNKKQENGTAFQTKLSITQLRVEILENKKSASEICKENKIKPRTLQQKLYAADCQASNKTEATKFLLDIPNEVSNVVEKKKNLTISAALCKHLEINRKTYEVSLNEKTGVVSLTPKI